MLVLLVLPLLIVIFGASKTVRGSATGALAEGRSAASHRWQADRKRRDKRREDRWKRWDKRGGAWRLYAGTQRAWLSVSRGFGYAGAFASGAARGARTGAARPRPQKSRQTANGTTLAAPSIVLGMGTPPTRPGRRKATTRKTATRTTQPARTGTTSGPPAAAAPAQPAAPSLAPTFIAPPTPAAGPTPATTSNTTGGPAMSGEVNRVGDVRDAALSAVELVGDAYETVIAAQEAVAALPDQLAAAGIDASSLTGPLADLASMDVAAGLQAWTETAAQVADAAQSIETTFTDAAAATGVEAGDVATLVEA